MFVLARVWLVTLVCCLGNVCLVDSLQNVIREDTVDWHESKEFNAAVWSFHDKYGKEPSMDEAKKLLTRYIEKKIIPYMEGKGMVSKAEFTGSAFQGLKISDNKLEFDVVLEMDGADLVANILEGYPSHRELRPANDRARSKYYEYLDDKGRISGKSLAEKYYGLLIHLQNYDSELQQNVKFRKHGPGVQMDVAKPGDGDTRTWFSVDLVPSFKLASGDSYVACPYKTILGERKFQDENMSHAWYLSFSLEERTMFNEMDQDGGCRKAAVRFLKSMAAKDGALKSLSSYNFKTLLLQELNEFPDKQWHGSLLGLRVMELLGKLQDALNRHNLEHYFIRGENLLRNIRKITIENMHQRVMNLRGQEKTMLKLIRGGQKDEL